MNFLIYIKRQWIFKQALFSTMVVQTQKPELIQ
jgi:hypothetical protein